MNQENITRTLAKGLSDITRHEAHTKAQGLNWSNANAPKYSTQITYEYVDLGLPSGTLWATMNVGATNETDPGLYFAWGETEGYTAEQVGVDKQFSWADYKFNPSGDGATFTKYTSTDNKTILDAEDDAASVNMGGDWHMPNGSQCEELLQETTNGFVTNEGVFTQYTWSDADEGMIPTETTATINGWNTAGYLFFKNTYISVTDAINAGDYLFIPAAGICGLGEIAESDISYVWSQSNFVAVIQTDVNSACHYHFDTDGGRFDASFRFVGLPVRGVIGELESQGGGEEGDDSSR